MTARWQVVVLREDVWGRSVTDITRMVRRGGHVEVWIPAAGPDGYHQPESDFAPYALVPYPAPKGLIRLWCIERVIEGSVTRSEMLKAQRRLPPLHKGELVHVIDGPLKDLVGVVDRATKNGKVRVRVVLESGDRLMDVKRAWVRLGVS